MGSLSKVVSDFCPINQVLKGPRHPNEGSSQILKKIPQEAKFLAVFDLLSGFHQVELPEKYHNLFANILATDKYRYRHLPLGMNKSPDIFNLVTHIDLWEIRGLMKYMDDIPEIMSSLTELVERFIYLLEICQWKNIKLSPRKMQIGTNNIFKV